MGDLGEKKLWANSGDSHLMEPPDLFDSLPEDVRERLPRSVKDPSGDFETIYIDGQEFRRDLPKSDKPKKGLGINARPTDSKEEDFINRVIGGNDPVARIKDLDNEGVWGEVMYPSLGIWTFNVRTPRVVKEGCRALNDWALDFQHHSPRFVCVASVPSLDIDDAVAEVKRAHEGGFLCGFLPTRPPIGRPEWNDEEWDPLWEAFAETGMVIGFHIGTEPHDPTERTGVYYRGRGGAVLNYVETTYGGQRAVTQLIACGALTGIPSSRSWSPKAARPGGRSSPTAWTRATASTARRSARRCPSCRAGTSTTRSTPRSSTTSRRWPPIRPWGGRTSCGAATTPTSRARSGTRRRRCTSCSTAWTPTVSRRIRIGAFQELFPSVPAPPED